MKASEILCESDPKIRKVKKQNADDSITVTYEVLNSEGAVVKSGLSKGIAKQYLYDHYSELQL